MSIKLPISATSMIPYFINEEISIFDIDTTGYFLICYSLLGLTAYALSGFSINFHIS